MNRRSVLYRSLMTNPGTAFYVDQHRMVVRNLELPSGGGVGTARAIANAYGVFASGGRELGLRPETIEELRPDLSSVLSDYRLVGPTVTQGIALALTTRVRRALATRRSPRWRCSRSRWTANHSYGDRTLIDPREDQHQHDERRRGKTVEDRGVVERTDRIDAD